MQYDASAAITISYLVGPLALNGNTPFCINDAPIPNPLTATYPPTTDGGTYWVIGDQITFVFGQLAPQDAIRFLAINGQSGTLTVPQTDLWIRCTGTFSWNANTKTLTFTLTQKQPIPYYINDPYFPWP